MTDLDRFLEMKEKVETKKTEIARKQGQLEGLKKQLLDEYSCKTVKQAQSKITKMENDLAEKEQEIEERTDKLEEQFEWL